MKTISLFMAFGANIILICALVQNQIALRNNMRALEMMAAQWKAPVQPITTFRNSENSIDIKHPLPPPAPTPPKVMVVDPLPPLEELMPKFEIRSNSPTDYRVAFKAHDRKEWTVTDDVLPTREDAAMVIENVKRKVELQYEIGKAQIESLQAVGRGLSK